MQFACSNKYRINTNYHILNIYRIFARHPKEVQSNGITHVLNLAVEDVKTGQEFYKDIGAKYFEVFADDHPDFDLKQCFEHASDIIDNAIKEGGKEPCHIIHYFRTNKHTHIFHIIKQKSNTFL
jgi:hypothetical protein